MRTTRTPDRWRIPTALLAIACIAGGGTMAVLTLRDAHNSGGSFIPPTVSRTIPPAAAATVPVLRGGKLATSIPVHISIPSIGVSADVTSVGKNPDGSVQVPSLTDHNLAGWYEHSPTPGQPGASVIVGHVDSYTGPSVFYKLRYLRHGQLIVVGLADGDRATFQVGNVVVVPKDQFPTTSVYGTTSYPALRVITCGGPFDAASGHYVDNIIVYANLTSTAQ